MSPVIQPPTPPLTPQPEAHDAFLSTRRDQHTADIVIIGAGIIGTALAITFARQSRSVILLEKSLKEPDRIVGELLQPGGCDALHQLGLAECLEEIDSIPVKGYHIMYYDENVDTPYPDNATRKGVKAEGRSFHHGRFVRRLREVAMKTKNLSVVETTATGLIRSDYVDDVLGVECLTDGKKDFYFGDLTIAADGYASKFRTEVSKRAPVAKSRFWALQLMDVVLPRPWHGHVVLGDGAPILLYQIGSRETRILIDVPEGTKSASPSAGGIKNHLQNVVKPVLPEQVRPAFQAALDEGKLRSMPNSFLPSSTNKTPGLLVLGDALNMRHPLTGGGMTVALNDVVLLRELLAPENVPQLDDKKAIRTQMSSFHWRRKNLSAVINILAQALYSLFAADDSQLKALQRGCFAYFLRGGNCIDGPVGLLGGIIRQPFVLFYHFFSVALLGMWLVLADSPLWKLPLTIVNCLLIFYKACVVLFPYILVELQT